MATSGVGARGHPSRRPRQEARPPQDEGRRCCGPSLPLRLLEVTQVGRWLVLAGRHEKSVCAEIVIVAADADMRIVLGAGELQPHRLLRLGTGVVTHDRPRPRQRMVGHRDLVMQDVVVRRVEIDALLEYRLVVGMQRYAGLVEEARALEILGLDLENTVVAIALLVDPTPEGIARKG